jgi:protein ImuA
LATGAGALDRALGGGLERDALCEIHADEARDAGAGTGFVLALASLLLEPGGAGPLLWTGTAESFREAGFPHAAGLGEAFAMPARAVLLAEARTPREALWIAGEASGLAALSAVIVEIGGDPPCLDLTATRRLQRRARAAGRPVFLLRLSAGRRPTAAPVRLAVAPAPAAPGTVFGRPLAGTLGRPAFTLVLEKGRAGPGGPFTLEWDCDERRFHEQPPRRQPAHPVAVVSPSCDRPDPAPASRQVVALGPVPRRRTG